MKKILFAIIGIVLVILGVLLMIDFLKLFLKSFLGIVLVIVGINLIFYRASSNVVNAKFKKIN